MSDSGHGIDGYHITARRNRPMKEHGHGVGEFHIVQRRAGKVVGEWKVHNLVTNVGLEALVRGAFESPMTKFDYIGLGNPASPAATTYATTALASELAADGITRSQVAVTVAVYDTNKWRATFAQKTWDYSGSGTTIREIGIFNAASGGSMFSRVSTADGGISWSGTTLANGDQISVTYTYTESAGTPSLT